MDLELDLINDQRAEIDFTSFLNGFPPSLQYFSVKCTRIQFNESTVSTNITILYIHCCRINKEFDDILSNCFPKLKILSLNTDVPEDINITIQNPNFKRARFYKSDLCINEHVFSFKSASQSDPEYYISRLTRVIPTTREEMPDLPILTFVSFAEQDFEIDRCQVIQIKSLGSDSLSPEEYDLFD